MAACGDRLLVSGTAPEDTAERDGGADERGKRGGRGARAEEAREEKTLRAWLEDAGVLSFRRVFS